MDEGMRAKTLDEFEQENEEASGGRKKKKPKAPTATKEPKKPKKIKKAAKNKASEANALEDDTERKRHPARKATILTSLFWMTLIGAVIAVCRLGYYDEYGEYKFLADSEGVIRGPILLFLNPEELSREEYYSAELDEITELTEDLESRHEDIDDIEAELEVRSDELDEWEARLQDWEDMLDEGISGDGTPVTATADIATLAKAWSEMTPANAAAAIAEIGDDALTVQVLRLVKFKSLGKILDAMSPDEAARISELLAEPPDID